MPRIMTGEALSHLMRGEEGSYAVCITNIQQLRGYSPVTALFVAGIIDYSIMKNTDVISL